MATGKALICKLQNIQSIEGADNIVQANLFGETVIISKDLKEGTIGLLFDCETQLSHEFCKFNNLYRDSTLNADKSKTGYIDENRRVRPIKLKGVRCSGLFLPIESVYNLSAPPSGFMGYGIGIEIDSFEGVKICQKYLTQKTRQLQGKNQGGKAKENLCPTFKEHIETDQALRNLHLIQEGNLVTITEKLHGTSGRCGYLPVKKPFPKWIKFVANYITSLLCYGKIGNITHKNEYQFIVGSRRVVKRIGESEREGIQSYYDTDIWSIASDKYFKGKLNKGESVYFEIVGYLPDSQPIMGSQSNSKLEKFMDKQEYRDFIAKYGETTEFSYGLSKGKFEVYVYRITMTNEDGESFDLSWDQVKMRCERMGVKHVPEISRFIAHDYDSDIYENEINIYTDQKSENFKSNLKEGIVLRIDNGANTPIFLKSKGYYFKVLEGIIKDSDVVDVEESQG